MAMQNSEDNAGCLSADFATYVYEHSAPDSPLRKLCIFVALATCKHRGELGWMKESTVRLMGAAWNSGLAFDSLKPMFKAPKDFLNLIRKVDDLDIEELMVPVDNGLDASTRREGQGLCSEGKALGDVLGKLIHGLKGQRKDLVNES